MDNTHLELITKRRSVKEYDTNFKLTEEEIKELLSYAVKAPSAWNLQHWKFIAVHSDQAKKKLFELAFNQKQVLDSSVTIIVLGDKQANKNAERVFEHLKGSDIYTQLLEQINQTYQIPNYGYESAFHNTAYATMQLINAATAKGLSTNPMGGFDRDAVAKEFDVDTDRYIPVVIVTIGKKLNDGRPSARFDINESVTFK